MGHGVRRRDVLDIFVGGLGLTLVSRVESAHAQEDPAAARPKPGDVLVRDGDDSKTPLTPADIVADAKPLVAWAMDPSDRVVRSASRFNHLVIVRIGQDIYAHTMICTHDGCDVTDWLKDEHIAAVVRAD